MCIRSLFSPDTGSCKRSLTPSSLTRGSDLLLSPEIDRVLSVLSESPNSLSSGEEFLNKVQNFELR